MHLNLKVFCFLLFGVGNMFSSGLRAQNLNSALLVNSTVPDSIFVCNDSVQFTLSVTNTDNQAATNLRLNPQFPDGLYLLDIVPGSGFGLDSTSNDTVPIFTYPILPGDSTAEISFWVHSSCALIESAIDGKAQIFPRVDYVLFGNDAYNEQAGGSVSFNILFPELSIQKISAGDIEAFLGDTVCREVEVTNGGNGPATGFDLLIKREGELDLLSIEAVLTPANQSVAISIDSTNADTLHVTFTNPTLIQPNDAVRFRICEVVRRCSESDNTSFEAYWGCGGVYCNEGEGNAMTSLDVSLHPGNPDLRVTNYALQPGDSLDFCDDSILIAGFDLINYGVQLGGNAYNIDFRTRQNPQFARNTRFWINGIDLSSIVQDSLTGTDSIWSLLFTQLTFDPDGPGGLSDLDGDGYFDDIRIGDTVHIDYEITARCPFDPTVCPNTFTQRLLNYRFEAWNQCWTFMGTRGGSWPSLFAPLLFFDSSEDEGPTDMGDGDTATFKFKLARRATPEWYQVFACSNDSVVFEVNVPSGFYLVGDSINYHVSGSDTVRLPVTYTSTGFYVNAGQVHGRMTFCFDLGLNCDGDGGSIGSDVSWELKYYCNKKCCPINLGCGGVTVSNHCSIPCERVNSIDLDLERQTYGWTDKTRTTRLNANNPGVDTEVAWPCDTVKMTSTGIVKAGSWSDVHYRLTWDGIPGDPSGFAPGFRFAAGEWSIPGATCPIDPTGVTRTFHNGKYIMDFPLDSTCIIGGSLVPGDSANIVAYLVVDDSLLPTEELQEFSEIRGFHYAQGATQDVVECESWGTNFALIKPHAFVQSNAAPKYLSCGGLQYQARVVNIVEYELPNEFRHYAKFDSIIEFIYPNYVEYIPGSAYFTSVTNFNTTVFDSVAPTSFSSGLEFDTLRFIDDSTWPLGQAKAGTHYVSVLNLDFVPKSCAAADSGLTEIKFNTGFNLKDYAFDTACHEPEFLTRRGFFDRRKPNLKLNPGNVTQDGFERDVTWEITICNPDDPTQFTDDADYLWFSLETSGTDLQIDSIINTTTGDPVTLVPYGNGVLVQAGSLSLNQCYNFDILGSYTNCFLNAVDTIPLTGGWACGGFPEHPDSADCPDLYNELRIRYKTADLQMVVETEDAVPINFCNSIPYSVLLNSSALGNMYEIELFYDLPPGLDLLPGSQMVEYPLGSTPQPLPAPGSGFHNGMTGWDLGDLVFGGASGKETGLIGVRDTNNNKVLVTFDLVPNCDFEPGSRVIVQSSGITNCNDTLLITPFESAPMELLNFPSADSLGIELSSSPLSCSDSAQRVLISLTNLGPDSTGHSGRVYFTFPDIANYQSGSLSPFANGITQDGQELSWEIPSGLSPGANLTYSMKVSLSDSICDSWQYIAVTGVGDTLGCGIDTCYIFSSNTSDTLVLSSDCCPDDSACTVDAGFTADDVCWPEPVTFTSNQTGGTHYWDFGFSGMNSNQESPTFYYPAPGEYTVTHTYAEEDCDTVTSTQIVTVLTSTTGAISVLGQNPFCEGDTVCLTVSGGAFDSIVWIQDGSLIGTGDTTCVNEPGVYAVVVTDTNGCVDSCLAISISNLPLPDAGLNDTVLCVGDSVYLEVGSEFQTYLWSDGSTNQGTWVTSTGWVWVEVTDDNGCVGRDSAKITPDSVSIDLPDVSGCPGDTIVLDAGSGFSSYSWNTLDSTQAITVYTLGTYSVTVTNAVGCEASDSVSVEPGSPPQAGFFCDTVCLGEVTTISAHNPASGDHTWLVEVYGNVTPVAGTATFDYYFPEGIHTVTHILTSPCGSDTFSCDIVVSSPPSGIIKLLGTSPFCEGDSVRLTVVGDYSQVDWLLSGSYYATGDTITAYEGGVYEAVISDSTGCSDTCLAICLTELPAPSIDLEDTLWACELPAYTTASPNTYEFLWSHGQSGAWSIFSSPGSYTVTASSSDGCTATDSLVVVDASISPEFKVESGSQICLGKPFVMAGLPASGPYTYNWWVNGTLVQSSNSSNFPHTLNSGLYAIIRLVVVDTLHGCSAATETLYKIYGERQCSYSSVRIAPNPVRSGNTLRVAYNFEGSKEGTLELVSPIGNKLKSIELDVEQYNYDLQIPKLAEGIYLLRFMVDGQLFQTEQVIVSDR